jgi:protein-arginine kinase activator protein McsA
MRAQDEGDRKTTSAPMRICPECGEKKDSAHFQATIDGKICRLAICFDCRAEQSKRFHRERKRRRMEVKV